MARGNYKAKDLLEMSDEEISFIYHYQNLVEQKREQFITSILGVMWSKEDFEAGQSSAIPERIMLPLSLAVNPNVASYVKSIFDGGGNKSSGSSSVPEGYRPATGEEVVSTGSLSKEDFLKLVGARN